MEKRVDVVVGADGRMVIELSGFEGDLCLEETENLHRVIRSLGLWAIPVTVVRKSESETALGSKEEKRLEAPIS